MVKRLQKHALVAVLTTLCLLVVATFMFLFVPTTKKASAEDSPLTEEQLSLVEAAGWFGTATITDADYKQTSAALSEDSYGDYGIVTLNVEIGTANGLAYLARLVNQNALVNAQGEIVQGANNLAVYNVTLTADIDLENKLWIPIGTTSRGAVEADHYAANLFRGTVDGANHKIKNLSSAPFYNHMDADDSGYYIDCGESRSIAFEVRKNEEYCWGLFATTADVEMKNITIEGVQIDMPKKAVGTTNILTDAVGALIGFNIGDLKVENCVSGKTDKSDYIRNTATTGGLVGRSYSGKQLVSGKYYAFGSVDAGCFVDGTKLVSGLTLKSEIHNLNNKSGSSTVDSHILPYYEEDTDGNIIKLYYKYGNTCYWINNQGKLQTIPEDDIKAAAEGETPTVQKFSYTQFGYTPTIQNLISHNQTEILEKIYKKAFDDMFGAGVTTTDSKDNGVLSANYLLGTIEFIDCKNYIDIDADDEFTAEYEEKKSGMLGFLAHAEKVKFENCENHGDLKCGSWVGGMTSFQARGFLGTEDRPIDRRFEFINCHNTGDIHAETSKTAGTAGGIVGITNHNANNVMLWSNQYTSTNILFKDCTNTGTITADSQAGGITGAIHLKATGVKIENCYNYGKVQGGYGTTSNAIDYTKDYSGGLVGYLSIHEMHNIYLPTVKDKYGNVVVNNLSDVRFNSFDRKYLIVAYLYYINNSNERANNGAYVYLNYPTKKINITQWDVLTNAHAVSFENLILFDYIESVECEPNAQTVSKFKSEFSATGGNLGTRKDGTQLNHIGYNLLNWDYGQNRNYGRDSYLIENRLYGTTTDVSKLPGDIYGGVDATEKYDGALTPVIEDNVVVGFNGNAAENDTDVCSVTIPATVTKIANGAFAGVSNLTSVTFEEGSNLREIGDWAFAGCEGLASVTLPAGIEKVGKAAFVNCTDLNTVVLPDDASGISFGDGALVVSDAPIIAKDSEQYKQLRTNQNYAACAEQLTYVVTIKYVLDGVELTDAAEQRLFGNPYTLVNNDGKWENAAISELGPQNAGGGYYVWYDSIDRSRVVQIGGVNGLLARTDGDEIVLYAFSNTDSKVFVAREGLVYNDAISYSMGGLNPILTTSSDFITSSMTAAITEYNGSTENLPTVIHNAGDYTVGIFEGDVKIGEFTVTIERAVIDLANMSNLTWNLTAIGDNQVNMPLITGSTLYIYTYADGESGEYPSTQLLTAEQIERLNLNSAYSTREVSYSVVRNRGVNVTVGIVGNGYTVQDVEGNSGVDVGVYNAQATIKADGNYKFVVGNISSLRGMSVVPTDETTATVTKRWYIVDLGNWLVAQGGADYIISNHEYGDDFAVSAPALYYTGMGGEITMHLYLNNTPIGGTEGFGVSEFNRYINSSMPAGDYRLEVSVTGVTTTESGAENEEETVYVYHNGFSETITFTVYKASLFINAAVFETGVNGYADYSWEVTANANKELFFKEFADKVNAVGAVGYTSVTRSGYWATEAANVYFGDYAITYNFAKMQNEQYLAANSNDLLEKIDADSPETYKVYFEITAPSHYNLTDLGIAGRYAYYFTVTVYKTLDAPTVIDDGLVYTGNKVLPEIADSVLYETIWSDTDEYVAGGTHSVSFRLYDKVHYRWNGVAGDTVTVNYTVDKATNDFTVLLSILGWTYESFDAALNNIRGTAQYLDEGETIHFRVVKKGETTALTDLGDFTIDEYGKVSNTVAALLNRLKTGTYTLYAKVNGTNNYNELEGYIDFAVSKALNSWAAGDDDLVLPSWVVGNYSESENPIVVNAAHGLANIVITDIDGNEYYNSATGLNKLNECEVGKYLLKAWVDETEDFAALERTFTIEVLEKIGLPWWGTLLIVIAALAVAALIIFILWKKGVFQILTGKIVLAIRTRANVDATIASVRAAKKMEEGRKSVAAAKRREKAQERREKAAAERALPAEERAAALEAKAAAEAAKAERIQARIEALKARAERMREATAEQEATSEAPVESAPETASEPAQEVAQEPVRETAQEPMPEEAKEAVQEPAQEVSQEPAQEAAATDTPKRKRTTNSRSKK